MRGEGDGRPAVVYVLGPGRSGSGVLGRLLSTIPGSAFMGELRRVWSRGLRTDRTCACGRPHATCPVWSRLLEAGGPLAEPGRARIAAIQRRVAPERLGWRVALARGRLTGLPTPGSPERRYVDAYAALYDAVARVTGASLVIDTSKSAADAALLALRPGPPTVLVQLIRDPRGVVSSLQRHLAPRTALGRRALAVRASLRWAAKHLANEALLRRAGPNRSLAIRYEDLVADPRPAVEAAAKLAGMPAPAERLAPGVPIPVPEAHGPEGSRRRRFETREIVLELDTRWYRELARIDRWLVTALTYPLLRRYGYQVRVPTR